jgi:hypothetical protein
MRLAADKVDRITLGISLDYRMPGEQAATLREWLDRAIALSPRYLEAHAALALVEAFAEQPRLAVVNRVQEVVPKMSDKMRTLLAIAIVHWRLKDYASARQIARLLVAAPRASPELRRLAQRLIDRLPSEETPAVSPEPPQPG